MTKNRPLGITILALLAGLGAITAIIYTLQMLHLLPVIAGPVAFFTFSLVGAFVWGIIAFIYIWLFQMIWTMQPQGWLFAVLLAIFNFIYALLSIIGASSWKAMLPTLIISGIILLYCSMPGTKQAFGVPE